MKSLFLYFTVLVFQCYGIDPPKWPDSYVAIGTLELPYAELKEPFTAMFDGPNKRSRMDFYGGMVTVIQVAGDGTGGNYGKSYKIAPMTDDRDPAKYNVKTCFLQPGEKEAPVEAQTALPDITGFKYIGPDKETNADMWQMENTEGNKKNTYTIWTKPGTNSPLLYEMMGYDSLLGSHYDKYYVRYLNVTAATFDNTSFTPPQGMTCSGFPGPGNSETGITMNPLGEFINNNDRHIDDMFDQFKKTHSKNYKNKFEHMQRKNAFRQNVRYIHSKNRAGLSYRLKVTNMADLSDEEMKIMRGYRRSGLPSNALPFSLDDVDVKDVPDTMDWRLNGAVTQVKDQAVCGSCWSFGTAEEVEGAYFVKTGNLVRLSQQELMDCSWGEGNNACDGGEDFRAYEWIIRNGLASEEDYGPYLAQDSYCNSKNVTPTARILGYHNVTKGDLNALKVAIAKQGPISVAIDASHKSLSFYSHGVYYEPDCGNTEDDLDHAVLAVGYGTMDGQDYWLVKNSWSTYWGNNGYVLMSQKDNNCGVATAATYVMM